LAAQQATREARSGFFPQLSANVVAVGTADDNTRLAAIGGLNNPAIFDRNAEGVVLSQLITDFGRVANLTRSAQLHAQAEADQAQATREQILLAVDGAYYGALQAQSVVRVAEQTVATRQLFLDQVTELTKNKLRSELDVSFAQVNLQEGRLLLSRFQNDLQASFARLANLLGSREQRSYRLLEEPAPPDLGTNLDQFLQEALRDRPDLLRARAEYQAAVKFARAERALNYPTISAIGSAGVVPVRDPVLPEKYAAAGLVLSLPLFNGGYYTARQKEAALRTQAASESVRDAENNVIQDVRIAWYNAQNALERSKISTQLAANAALSFELAQARYRAGLNSIVEFNQAQLNQISAEITAANTKYEYLLRRAALNFAVGARP
jgi:outer membrane protein